jgi:general secretion pathway protein B
VPSVASSKPAAQASASSAELPLVRELPEDVRERLGRLEVSAHVYAENPAERFVFINGKVCRVGDRIGEGGAVLERITPDGAVIDYGGGRARLETGR